MTALSKLNYYDDVYSLVNDLVIDTDDYLNVNTEKFMFSEFPDYIDADYYHRLDIKNLKMSYYAPNIMKNAKGYLRFYDYYNIFPYLDNNETVPYFDIPVIAKEKNNEIYMSFSGNFFVNIQTLEMSFVKRGGFVKTNYFYLPLNKSNQLLDQMFTLHFDSFGFGETSFSWDMRYITNRHLVGNCDDSEYCVKGEIVNA